MKNQLFVWIVKLTAVIILLQTLFFKFSGAQESIYIFQTLGVEPYGRIGSGVIELIASILILIPKNQFGATKCEMVAPNILWFSKPKSERAILKR